MPEREIINLDNDIDTKEKLLLEGTKLFAMNGYDAVSIRDIAKNVGIKSSSIYKHYESKEALFEAILSSFEASYRDYFAWLTNANKNAASLDEVMDNMFMELLQIRDISTYYGISITLKEQFNNESARKRVFKLFYLESVQLLQQDFDRLVEKKIIPPCDTNMIATLLMNCVLIGNEMRIHENMQHDIPVSATEMYNRLKRLITTILKNGF